MPANSLFNIYYIAFICYFKKKQYFCSGFEPFRFQQKPFYTITNNNLHLFPLTNKASAHYVSVS